MTELQMLAISSRCTITSFDSTARRHRHLSGTHERSGKDDLFISCCPVTTAVLLECELSNVATLKTIN